MNTLLRLLIIALPLSLMSCAPFQMAGTNKSGPYVVQSGGFGHKMKGGVLKAKHGAIVLEQILEEPDGTEIPKQISSDRLTLGLGKLWQKSDQVTREYDGQSKLKGTNDPENIPVDPHQPVTPGNPSYVAPPEEVVPTPPSS